MNIQKPVWIIYINFQIMSNFEDFLIGIWTPQLSKSISPPWSPPGSALYSLAVAALNIKRRAFRVAEGAQSHSEAWIAARMAKYKTSTTMMTSKKQHQPRNQPNSHTVLYKFLYFFAQLLFFLGVGASTWTKGETQGFPKKRGDVFSS